MTTACPKPTVRFEAVKESIAESLAPPFHQDPGEQGRHCSHPPVQCGDLGSLTEADQLLERFNQRCLRSTLGIKYQDYVSNEEIPERASLPSIENLLFHVQLRWAGHFARMEHIRLHKAVFFSELQEGKRDRSVPRKRYKEQLQRQLAQPGLSCLSWQQEASDRDS